MASLASLRNSAALVVFGKGLVVLLLFVDVLFNLTRLLPVKQEKSLKLILTENLENANVNFVSLSLLGNLLTRLNLRSVVKCVSSFVFFRANSGAFQNKFFRAFVLKWPTFK